MQVKINKIYRSDKDKDGNPLTTKDGRPYIRIAIQCSEYGAKWISGFANRWNDAWKEFCASHPGSYQFKYRHLGILRK